MNSKKENIIKNTLFIFGIILLIFSFVVLVYQIVHLCNFDWSTYEDKNDAISYVILEFVTIIFKIIISSYAIYAYKHLDDALNPLFTFTLFYVLFVIMQFVKFFISGAFSLGLMVTLKAFVDVVVATFFFISTVSLKIDDWRSEEGD